MKDTATIEMHDKNGVVKAVTIIDAEDLPKLEGYNKWQLLPTGYAWTQKERRDGKKRIRQHFALHRVIMNAPKGFDVDHINGNPLDNRKSNLRICTHADNGKNLTIKSNNKSGVSGVCWITRDRRWCARIKHGDKYLSLGYYKDKADAIKARRNAEKIYFGEFARSI